MCAFCDIATGRADAAVVFDDEASIAFLDIRPLFPGHTLLIPRTHYETLSDLPTPDVGGLFANTQLLTRAVERAMQADGSLVLMNNRVSQSVPHLHVHVIPRRRKDGLRGFLWPRHPYESTSAMAETAEAIRAAVHELRV